MAKAAELGHAQRVRATALDLVAEAERRLKEAREQLGKAEGAVHTAEKELQQLEAAAGALADPNVTEVAEQLEQLEQTNDAVRHNKLREELAAQLEAKRKESAELSKTIEDVDREKAETLAAVRFPVDGLGFDASGVTLHGVPLEQASSAEQLRVSLGMGLALNPDLKVLLIRDGSLLDEKSLQLVAEQADAAGAQVWLEVVGAQGVGVVIEDGSVVGAASGKPEAPAEKKRGKATR